LGLTPEERRKTLAVLAVGPSFVLELRQPAANAMAISWWDG
jgi:hypothetical protein